MDIHAFRTAIPGGGARPSNFEIFFPVLPNIEAAITTTLAQVPIRAKGASLPAARMTSIPIFYQGRPIQVGGERVFNPWRVTFYNDVDFALRDFFESWNNMMNTMVGNQVLNTDDIMAINGGYKVDGVIVRQLNKQLQDLRAYEFFGMYPEDVGEIQLDWEQGNRIEIFDVTFAYDFWIPSESDTDQLVPGSYDVEGVGANTGIVQTATSTGVQAAPQTVTVLPVSSGIRTSG